MSFPDQAGLVVRIKDIEVGKPFIVYHDAMKLIYGRLESQALKVYTRIPPDERFKGILGGMIDGSPCPFDENTEVVRCSL